MTRSHQFSADLPLKHTADDRLDRKRFSAELAHALASWNGNESLVVSLCGEWGSGKSTLKNFVIEELDKCSPKPIVGEFNPWQWSGQDKLLEGFLAQLATLLGKPELAEKTDQLLRKYKVFAAALGLGKSIAGATQSIIGPLWFLTAANFAGLLLLWGLSPRIVAALGFIAALAYAFFRQIPGVAESLITFLEAKHASQQKTLEELRLAVANEMAKVEQVVIVFIDDIDRLTDQEIKLLIQLVKANVHFPNLIYCLLYQKDIIAASLGKIISDDGDKYLRKIVQVQFDVPVPSKRQLQKLLTDDLERILTRKDIVIVQDIGRWNEIFPEPLWGYFQNVRDVKRFLAAFEFYFNMHINGDVLEVNPIDLIAIETLRMFDHQAYRGVGASFFRKGIVEIDFLDSGRVAQSFSDEIKLIVDEGKRDPQSKRRLEQLLNFLFPQAQSTGRRGGESDWLTGLRICHANYFDRYFQLSLNAGQVSARDLFNLIDCAGDRAKLTHLLRQSLSNGGFADVLDFIAAALDRIPTEKLTAFVTALFDVADSFPEGSGGLGSDPLRQCIHIIFHRLKTENVQTRTDILWHALEATTGLSLPIRLLGMEDSEARRRNPRDEYLIGEKDMPRFCEAALLKIREKAGGVTLLNPEYSAGILYRWKEWTDGSEVQAWIQRVIGNPNAARRLLAKLIAKSYIGARMEPLLHGQSIEVFLPIETLLGAAEKADAPPSDFEKAAMALLKTAVKLKQAGKPYAEVRPEDSRF